jgi:hypothetical protein
MKKEKLYVAVYFAVITFIASLVSSCAAGHASCDAYGQANYSQNQDTASK